MPNVHLEPGPKGSPTPEQIIADTKDGVLIDGRGSYSIDQQRYNGQFGGDAFWEIKNGKKTRQVTDVTYNAITTEFWANLNAIAGTEYVAEVRHRRRRQGAADADEQHLARLALGADREHHGRSGISMSTSRRTFIKSVGAAGVAVYSSDLLLDLLAQTPAGNVTKSRFKGLADIVLTEAKTGGCSYADVRFTMNMGLPGGSANFTTAAARGGGPGGAPADFPRAGAAVVVAAGAVGAAAVADAAAGAAATSRPTPNGRPAASASASFIRASGGSQAAQS